MEWGGNRGRKEGRSGPGRGWFGWQEGMPKSKPLPGLHLPRSKQTCVSDVTDTDLSRPGRPAQAYPGEKNKCSFTLRRHPEAETPAQDAAGTILVPLDHNLGNYGGLGCE